MKVWIMVLTIWASIAPISNALAADHMTHNSRQQASLLSDGNESKKPSQHIQLRLHIANEDKEVVVVLDDNPASRDLLSMLPLTLTFEDYNGTEKISSLPRKLHIQNAPSSCDPEVGSFTYYAPWGNLAIFYRDFRHSNGLVPLGQVTSGMETLANIRDGSIIRLEKAE